MCSLLIRYRWWLVQFHILFYPIQVRNLTGFLSVPSLIPGRPQQGFLTPTFPIRRRCWNKLRFTPLLFRMAFAVALIPFWSKFTTVFVLRLLSLFRMLFRPIKMETTTNFMWGAPSLKVLFLEFTTAGASSCGKPPIFQKVGMAPCAANSSTLMSTTTTCKLPALAAWKTSSKETLRLLDKTWKE